MKHRVRTWPKLLGLALIIAVPYVGLRRYEHTLLYSPAAAIGQTPATIDLRYDDIYLTTADGETIHSWFLPADASSSSSNHVLYLHGPAGNLGDCLPKLRRLHELGLNVLAIDYRGYGSSTGVASESGLILDALAGYYYVTRNLKVEPEQLFVFGESLGGSLAIQLAAKVPAAGLILEAPVASGVERLRQKEPRIPWDTVARDRYEVLGQISFVRMPLLIIHSLDDEDVPVRDSKRLFSLALEPKELLTINGKHAVAFVTAPENCGQKVADFIEQAVRTHQLAAANQPIEQGGSRQGQTSQ